MSNLSNKDLGISLISMGKQNFDLLIDCIKSFKKHHQAWNRYNLYVIINHDDQTYKKKIEIVWPGVHLILNKKVESYSQNHNKNIAKMIEKYVLLLNDDKIFKENVVDGMIKYLNENKNVYAVSPQILNNDETLQQSINSEWTVLTVFFMYTGLRKILTRTKWGLSLMKKITMLIRNTSPYISHDHIQNVKSFAGPCYFVRRTPLKRIGLMDEVTQYWGEESEWHRRIRSAGGRVVYNPNYKVLHLGGRITDFLACHYKSKKLFFKRDNYSIKLNRAKAYINYFEKWNPGVKYTLVRMIILGFTLFDYLFALLRSDQREVEATSNIIRIVKRPRLMFQHSLRYNLKKKSAF